MLKKLIYFISICSFFFLNAQENQFQTLEKEIMSLSNQREKALIKSKYYIQLSKKKDNQEETYKGYLLAGYYSDYKDQLKYGDSLLDLAIQFNDSDKIGEAYSTAGDTYQLIENYNEALKKYLTALKYYKKNNNPYNINIIKYNIGKVKYYLGDFKEAEKGLKEAVDYFRNEIIKKKSEKAQFYYLYSLNSLIDTNTKLGNFTQNKILISEGKAFTLKNEDLNSYYPFFISSEGTDFYFQKDYQNAIVKLETALKSYNDDWKHLTEKFYLGMSYWQLRNYEKAMTYFQLIDADYDSTGKLYPEFRPTFEKIIEYYKQKGDKEKQLIYTEKLLKIDQDLHKSVSEVSAKMHKEFDTPNLIAENEKQTQQNLLKYGVGILVMGLLGVGIFAYLKNKNKPVAVNHKDQHVNVAMAKPAIDYDLYKPINKETVKQILSRLETFEEEKQYTEKGLKLSLLANKFGTNERYLSQIIKTKTGKNFNEYLSDLRLNLFETLSSESSFSSQNLNTIASQLGFTNQEMFIKEFKNKFGVTPRVYLDGLKS